MGISQIVGKQDPIVPYIPKTGWIADYMKWTEETEASRRFRFFTALSVLSSAVLRQVYLPYGDTFTYPNIWILLMGKSGCGKDLALGQGYRLIRYMKHPPKRLAEKITPEAFVKKLHSSKLKQDGVVKKGATGVLFAPELSNFLGKVRYNEGMITMLTRVFDCPDEYPTDTVTRSDVILENVCMTMMWGSTPEWYRKYMPDGVMHGGFMSRIIFVFHQGREKVVPRPPKFCQKTREYLADYLNYLRNLEGEVKFEEDCGLKYDRWYSGLPDPHTTDEPIEGSLSRKPLFVKKFAMLFMLSERGSLELKSRHVQRAIGLYETMDRDAIDHIQTLGITKNAQTTEWIHDIIKKHPDGITKTALMRRTYRKLEGRVDEFHDVLEWLFHLRMIKKKVDGAGSRAKTTYFPLKRKAGKDYEFDLDADRIWVEGDVGDSPIIERQDNLFDIGITLEGEPTECVVHPDRDVRNDKVQEPEVRSDVPPSG